MHNVLIIDDDLELCLLIKRSVLLEDIEADFCNTGKAGLQKLKEKQYQLVILDVMMPGMDGFETLEKIRKESSLPILMFTSKNDSASKVRGLRAGADDYLTKPFQSAVLIARIEAHLRRHHKHFLDEIKFEDVMMNTKNREVTIDDHVIVLTKVEYDLLKMFMEHPKEAVSRETLLQSIWGFQYDGDTRIVDVHVFKLKGKLKESRVSFKSVRGVGYKLVKKDD